MTSATELREVRISMINGKGGATEKVLTTFYPISCKRGCIYMSTIQRCATGVLGGACPKLYSLDAPLAIELHELKVPRKHSAIAGCVSIVCCL